MVDFNQIKLLIHKLIICEVKDYKFTVLNHEELFQSVKNKAFGSR